MNYLYMNISAALIIFSSILIRKITINKIPHSIFSYLWVLAIIRLLIPYHFGSDFSVFNLSYKVSDFFYEKNLANNRFGISKLIEVTNALIKMDVIKSTLFVFWFVGFACVATRFIYSYICGRRIIKDTIFSPDSDKIKSWLKEFHLRRNPEIRISFNIEIPLSYGVIKSGIIIPHNLNLSNEKEIKQIILHEYMHIKYCHSWLKIALAIIASINWYNPAVWLLYKYINRDMEICCDRHVLLLMGGEERESYAMNLIHSAEKQCDNSVVCSGFTKESIRERIVAIMNFKKISIVMFLVSMIIPASVTTVFATNDNEMIKSTLNQVAFIDIEAGATVEKGLVNPEEDFTEQEISTYVLDSQTRASKSLRITSYEYVTYSTPPDTLIVTLKYEGYTYSGTLSLDEYNYKSGKYTAYYTGYVYR